MSITKPYFRVIRPFKNTKFCYVGGGPDRGAVTIDESYLVDTRYAPDRISLIRAFKILERDLIRLFDYVEPSDENLCTYSHRLYELLLRSCTEFETNGKLVLSDNGYKRKNGTLDITDYYKLEQSSKLSEYQVKISIWKDGPKVFTPFFHWSSSHTLSWYQDYNLVKHNRYQEFKRANLSNVIEAISGLIAVLFSQFLILVFKENGVTSFYHVDDMYFHEDSIFGIRPPQSWTDDESYDFDWDQNSECQQFKYI